MKTPADLRSAGQATPLPERMQKSRSGQATWAEPLLRRNCTNCHHYTELSAKTHKGMCELAFKRNGRKITFDGGRAIACMDWKEPE